MNLMELYNLIETVLYRNPVPDGNSAFTNSELVSQLSSHLIFEISKALSDANISLDMNKDTLEYYISNPKMRMFILATIIANSYQTQDQHVFQQLYDNDYPAKRIKNAESKKAYLEFIQEKQNQIIKSKEDEEKRKIYLEHPWAKSADVIKSAIEKVSSQEADLEKMEEKFEEIINDENSSIINMYYSILNEHYKGKYNPLVINLKDEDIKDIDKNNILSYYSEQSGLSYSQIQTLLRYDFLKKNKSNISQEYDPLNVALNLEKTHKILTMIRENGVEIAQLSVNDLLKAVDSNINIDLDDYLKYLAIKNWIFTSDFDYKTKFTPEVMDVLYRYGFEPQSITKGNRPYDTGVEEMIASYTKYINDKEQQTEPTGR